MQDENDQSYKAIIYLLLVAFSFFVMHINLKVNYHYQRKEIKNLEVRNSKNQLKKRVIRRKPVEKRLSKASDSLTKADTIVLVQKDTIDTPPEKITDLDYFENLLEEYNTSISEGDGAGQSRSDVVIRYYKKSKDGDRVYKLRELGYYIHERPAEGNFDHFGSNAIFYGDSVKREDLVLIAYNLINSGLTLQNISLSKFHDTWKAHSVEIGTDTTVFDQPQMTLSTLRKSWRDF